MLLLFYQKIAAQQELTLFFSNKIMPVNSVNPAGFKSNSTVISFPSIAFNYGNNAFTFNELFREEGNDTYLNLDGVLGQLSDKNIIQTQFTAELFSIQFRVKKVYFTVAMAEKLDSKLTYSDKLINLAWKGNAQYIGEEIEIGPAINATAYREMSLGTVYEVGKFTFGNRLRFLSGRLNVSTRNEKATLYTDDQYYQSHFTTDYEVYTSGLDDLSEQEISPLASTGNPGFATDFGVVFQPSEKWKISTSILDLGYINWKKNIKRYKTTGDFSFNGLHLNEYFETDTFQFEDYLDSLKDEFDPDITHNSYKNNLIPRLYVGITRKINEKQEFGVLGYGEFFRGFQPAFMLYHGYSPFEKTTLGVSYSIKNKLFNHLGVSLSQQIKRFQIYFVTDDVINSFKILDTRSINFRFGMAFHLGSGNLKSPSTPKKEPAVEENEEG